MTKTGKWTRILNEDKRKKPLHVISYPEYEQLKLSAADEKRYREEYLGIVIEY